MDLDADLKRLKTWKNEVAELLTPRVLTALLALAASEQAGDIGEHVTAVQKTVDGFDARLKAIESAKPADGADPALADRVTSIESKLAGLQAPDLAEIVARLDVIDTKLVVLSDPAMVDLLNWLAANREGLDVLLSLGGDDQANPGNATGQAAPAPDSPAGAGSAAPGASSAGDAQDTQAPAGQPAA